VKISSFPNYFMEHPVFVILPVQDFFLFEPAVNHEKKQTK